MIRVLHIAPGFKYGGIESRLIDWYSGMDRDQIHFDVVKVTPDESNPLVDKMRELGAEVYSIPPLGMRTWRQHFVAMRKIIESGQYDVVHSHSTAYGFCPLLIAKKLGIKKRVLHSRTTNYNPGERHILVSKVLTKLAVPIATDYFACSEEAGKWAFGKRTVSVIRNGIELDKFTFSVDKRNEIRRQLGLLAEDKVIGFVGRFSAQKNIPFLIKVFNSLHKQNPHFKLLMIGDGPLWEEAHNMVNDFQLDDAVMFIGRQENVNDWMNAMDVFAFPSLFEGFGTVAIEAQANGLPCVLSSAIPRSTNVSRNVTYENYEDAECWVRVLEEYLRIPRENNAISIIRNAGYDVNQTIIELEKYYLSRR